MRANPALRLRLAALFAASSLVFVPLGASASNGGFVEPVDVLYELHGQQPGGLFGWAVSELADIDADGVTDLIVSAVTAPPNFSGRVFVFSGASGDPIYEFAEEGERTLFGYGIADAGDVNADGVDDIVVGARFGNRTYVYSGATGDRLLTLSGDGPGDEFGFAVASAGDVNLDGHDDILVGAPRNDAVGLDAGRAYVMSGVDGSTLRTYDAASAGDLFGSGTDWVADVNSDGRVDHVIGARDGGRFRDGEVTLFSGATGQPRFTVGGTKANEDLGWFFVAGLGDVNDDAVPDVYAADFTYSAAGNDRGAAYVLSGTDGTILRSWFGSSAGQGFGPGREAGDVDGDGTPDIIVGSYLSSDGAREAGKAEVFSGEDGTRIRSITSLRAGEQLGFDAMGLGDLNGDGLADLVVSAAEGDVVYVIAGED